MLIFHDERPAPCPAGLIEGLQALADENGIFNGTGGIRTGDTARTVATPFAEFVAP